MMRLMIIAEQASPQRMFLRVYMYICMRVYVYVCLCVCVCGACGVYLSNRYLFTLSVTLYLSQLIELWS